MPKRIIKRCEWAKLCHINRKFLLYFIISNCIFNNNKLIIIIIRFVKRLRPWLQRRWRQISRGCYSKALRKTYMYVLSLDLKTESESALIIVSGNKFQTVGAEQRKVRLAKSVLMNSLSSSGTPDD